MKKIELYLGEHVSRMLSASPFCDWPLERSIEEDLDPPIVHYVFSKHGLELRCDGDDRIVVIFIFSSEYGGFDECLLETPFSWTRLQVLARFGVPAKSGNVSTHPILGRLASWDRFSMQGYAIRFEYTGGSQHIAKITLMKEVPS